MSDGPPYECEHGALHGDCSVRGCNHAELWIDISALVALSMRVFDLCERVNDDESNLIARDLRVLLGGEPV